MALHEIHRQVASFSNNLKNLGVAARDLLPHEARPGNIEIDRAGSLSLRPNIEEHQIHSEWFSLSEDTAKRLNDAKKAGKQIVAVGTTTVRVLESCSDEKGRLVPKSGETKIYIYPGYGWKFVDQMITNFHVPKSTLLMLVSSFANFHSAPRCGIDPNTKEIPACAGMKKEEVEAHKKSGLQLIMEAYETAKKAGYRFFSFGDAMWIR